MRADTCLAEAARAAAAQRIPSILVATVCAAVCTVTLLTAGRAAAAEAQVLSRLESAGSRQLVVTDESGSGLITPAVLSVVAGMSSVERVIGVDQPVDVTNAAIGPGGTRTPAWILAGELSTAVSLVGGRWPRSGEAIVAVGALDRLGLKHPAGAVEQDGGRQYPVVGALAARAPFEFLDAGVVFAHDGRQPVRSIYVVVSGVDVVRATERAVILTIDPTSNRDLTIQSPTGLAELQQAVGGDLGAYGRGSVLLAMGGGGLLVVTVILADVLIRRRDLGRRRALGASRWALTVILVVRTAVAAVPGAVLGLLVGTLAGHALGGTAPWAFAAGAGVLMLSVASVAAVPPALLAAYRDPVRLIRTP